MTETDPADPPVDTEDRKILGIQLDKACYVINLAREFDAKVEPIMPDHGSNETDDGDRRILEDHADDETFQTLMDALKGLSDEEIVTLLALMWLGRGDETVDDWENLLKEAEDIHDPKAPEYLVGTPLLSSYLEEGLSKLGYSCVEMGYLYED